MVQAADKKEITVEEKLLALHELQEVATSIDKIKTLRGELPLEVQDLEDEVAGLTTRIEKYKAEISQNDQEIKNKKIEISEANDLIEKYNTQLNNVSNNREYDRLSKEIEFKQLENTLAEKRIKEFTYAIENKQAEVNEAEALKADKVAVLSQKQEELDNIIKETKTEEEKLIAKAQKIEETIEPRLLSAFKRIRKNARNGLAVVGIDRDACGGCFNKIPAQRQLDIRSRKKIIVCEYCGRILVDAELGKNPSEEVQEEVAPKKTARKTASKKTTTKKAAK